MIHSPAQAHRGAAPLLALDADINQHLAAALGMAEEKAVPAARARR